MKLCTVCGVVTSRAGSRCTEHARQSNRSRHNADSQQRDPGSLFHFYRELIALRRTSSALTLGRYEADRVDGAVWSFQRVHGEERVLVAINYGDTPAALDLPARAHPLYPKSGATPRARATLPPLSLRIYRLEAR